MAKRVQQASGAVEQLVARFPSRFRDRVRRCAAISSNIAQLAHTFPLLLYALAIEYGPHDARLDAIRLVELGRPLAEAAAAIGLPACLRGLPPEACRDPLAWTPFSPDFSRLIANHVPVCLQAMPNWVAAVFYAAHSCDEPLALWVAKQRLLNERYVIEPCILFPLALFAWHSQRRDTALRKLVFSPWTPRSSYKSVV